MKNRTNTGLRQLISSKDLPTQSAGLMELDLVSLSTSIKNMGMLVFLLGIMLTMNSCNNDDPTGPVQNDPEPTGSIHVKITTLGEDDDPEGYILNIEGSSDRQVEANGEFTIENKRAGRYTVELTNIASHCAGSDNMVKEVNVTADGIATVEFEVGCKAILRDRIVYAKGLPNFTEMKYYSSKLDGTDERLILDQVINFSSSLRISPDGTKLTFTDRVEGTNMQQIFVMDADGQNLHMIPYIQSENAVLMNQFTSIWHPDGKKLTFRKALKIVTYDLETEERRELEFEPDEFFLAEDVYDNGNKFLGTYFKNTSEGIIRYIATMNTDGTNLKFLKESKDLVFYNIRIVNENSLVYIQRTITTGFANEIWLMNIDGSEDKKISDKLGIDEAETLFGFSLSPDKSEFVLDLANGPNFHFAKTKVNGTPQRINYTDDARRINPVWSSITRK